MTSPVAGRPARLRVGVVGAGRVGSVFGAALHAAGHRVAACSGLSRRSQERAQALLPGVPMYDVEDVVARAELLLLTVPEPDLVELIEGLSVRRVWQAGQIVVHTSARHGLEVFEPAATQHILPLALHPAMRFTGSKLDVERLAQVCVAVTSTAALRPVGEALVVEMGAEPVWVAQEQRPRYAAAVAHVMDHVGVVVEQAAQVLQQAEIEDVQRLLRGVLACSLDGALHGDRVLAAQAAVADVEALRAHLQVLSTSAPDTGAVHLAVARAAAARALSAGLLGDADIDRLFDVLTDRPAAP